MKNTEEIRDRLSKLLNMACNVRDLAQNVIAEINDMQRGLDKAELENLKIRRAKRQEGE